VEIENHLTRIRVCRPYRFDRPRDEDSFSKRVAVGSVDADAVAKARALISRPRRPHPFAVSLSDRRLGQKNIGTPECKASTETNGRDSVAVSATRSRLASYRGLRFRGRTEFARNSRFANRTERTPERVTATAVPVRPRRGVGSAREFRRARQSEAGNGIIGTGWSSWRLRIACSASVWNSADSARLVAEPGSRYPFGCVFGSADSRSRTAPASVFALAQLAVGDRRVVANDLGIDSDLRRRHDLSDRIVGIRRIVKRIDAGLKLSQDHRRPARGRVDHAPTN